MNKKTQKLVASLMYKFLGVEVRLAKSKGQVPCFCEAYTLKEGGKK
jgi:hypothetical protein